MAALGVSGGRCCLLVFLVATSFVAAAALAAAEPGSMDDYVDHFVREHEAKGAQLEAQSSNGIRALSTPEVTAAATVPSKGRTIVVDQSGKGDYKKVQQAVNSVPKGNKKRVTIIIRNGVYREKIVIPEEKPFITFQCSGRKTILVYGDTSEKAGGTSKSASTAVESEGFIATDCTFTNSAPAPPGGAVGKQAVALRIQGDKAAFYRCYFYGAQDTLYDKAGRHYFQNCFIQGSIDFIFGDGQSLYENCRINSIARQNSGSITAQKRGSNSYTGFSFVNCRIGGSGTIYLGRAWGTHSRVVFIRCYMANMVLPVGWQDWNDPKRQKTTFYAEYACSGPGSNRKGRVKWSKVLTAKQAAPFSTRAFIDGPTWMGW